MIWEHVWRFDSVCCFSLVREMYSSAQYSSITMSKDFMRDILICKSIEAFGHFEDQFWQCSVQQ